MALSGMFASHLQIVEKLGKGIIPQGKNQETK